jgi:TRAP-type mannitol/chloroaromatic compound transport system substrate-binding protein
MIKNKKSLKGSKTPSRRKFFKAAAATGAAAATAVAMPNVAFGAPLTLKMQAAWPSGANIFLKWQEIMQKWLVTCLTEN